jgi:UDP-N-acetylglucosamine:LPS N-acetylglucosamine transferase
MKEWFLPIGVALSSKRVFSILRKRAPDIIVSTTDIYSKLLGEYAHRSRIPFFMLFIEGTICRDAISPHAEHVCQTQEMMPTIRSFDPDDAYLSTPLIDATFLERVAFICSVLKQNLSSNTRGKTHLYRVVPGPTANNDYIISRTRILIEEKFYTPQDRAAIIEKYNFREASLKILIMAGSLGGEFVREMAARVATSEVDAVIDIVALCGTDVSARKSLAKLAMLNRRGTSKIFPFNYDCQIEEIMAVTDLAITRPTSGSTLELLFKGIPLLASKQVLVCDQGYIREMEKRGLAETVSEDFESQLARMLKGLSAYRQSSERFREENCFKSYAESKEFICSLMLGSRVKADAPPMTWGTRSDPG